MAALLPVNGSLVPAGPATVMDTTDILDETRVTGSTPGSVTVGGCPSCDCSNVALGIGLGLGLPLLLLLCFNIFCFARQCRRRRAASQMQPLFPITRGAEPEKDRKISTDDAFPMTNHKRIPDVDRLPAVPDVEERTLNSYVEPPSSPNDEPINGYDYPDVTQETSTSKHNSGYLEAGKQEEGGHDNLGYLSPDAQVASPGVNGVLPRPSLRGSSTSGFDDDIPPPPHTAPSKPPSIGYVNSVIIDPAIMKMPNSKEIVESMELNQGVPAPPIEPPPEDPPSYYNEKRNSTGKVKRRSELDRLVAVPGGEEPEPFYMNSSTDISSGKKPLAPTSAYMDMTGTKVDTVEEAYQDVMIKDHEDEPQVYANI